MKKKMILSVFFDRLKGGLSYGKVIGEDNSEKNSYT